MRGARVMVVLCAVSVSADMATAAPPATPDVNAKWLEGFRRVLVRASYDYGPAGAASSASGTASPARASRSTPAGGRTGPAAAAASRELGISRRDLRGPTRGDTFTDVKLDGPDAPRRAFLESLYELEENLKPVYIQSNKRSRNNGDILQESRKRWTEQNTEEEVSRYIDDNGIKRYKVHANPKERLVGAIPGLTEEWGTGEPQEEAHGDPSEGRYRQYDNKRTEDRYRYVDRTPYNRGKIENKRYDPLTGDDDENRLIKFGDAREGARVRPTSVQGVNMEQLQRGGSYEGRSWEARDVEYRPARVRSRYVEDGRRVAGGAGGGCGGRGVRRAVCGQAGRGPAGGRARARAGDRRAGAPRAQHALQLPV